MTRRQKIVVLSGAVVALVVLIVTAIAVLVHVYRQNGQAHGVTTSQRIVGEVGQIYDLPDYENPTVAKVDDANNLRGHAFFRHAQNGDYAIIYSQAKLALLYRESTHKLINVAPIALQSTDSPASQSTTNVQE